MKAALLALAVLALAAQTPGPRPPPVAPTGPLPTDPKDSQPILLGPTTPAAILAHRKIFRDNLATLRLSPTVQARWQAVRRPYTLVAVFGSWCGDSHLQLPDLLALEAEPNPFVEVHFLGVARDKQLAAAAWPQGCPPQPVVRVPTFYLFALVPGGKQKLVGTVVENPPRAGQTMAEALVGLIESDHSAAGS